MILFKLGSWSAAWPEIDPLRTSHFLPTITENEPSPTHHQTQLLATIPPIISQQVIRTDKV